ncbi:restin homolog isoform X4 [Petaurus breviceps papuanus]|uniref:restin homolog isoform X4 n=1 Tax=Petaurus breviceps papuanus TaxID=3040969 RepID=UPI0036DC9757
MQQQEEKEDRLSDKEDEPQQSRERVHRDSSTRKHSAAEKMQQQEEKQDSPTRKPSAAEEIEQQAEEVSRVKITPME